jgi:hypothetical protein
LGADSAAGSRLFGVGEGVGGEIFKNLQIWVEIGLKGVFLAQKRAAFSRFAVTGWLITYLLKQLIALPLSDFSGLENR